MKRTINLNSIVSLLSVWSVCISTTSALDLDITSKESICAAGNKTIRGMLDYYDGYNYGGVVGMFSPPYYWWQAGHAFGGIMDYWHYCDGDEYEDILYESLIAQTGDNFDYIPKNQSTTEGNDDQGFWGIFVLAAAEKNFTAPKEEGVPDWLAMGQAVYNTMWSRWDMDHCGGGLRWQIFTWNSGYNYKNTVSTACLLNIAGRLARFTGNDTYVETSEIAYNWLIDVGYVYELNNGTRVYDGGNVENNCTDVVRLEWTYNFGLVLGGLAYLYNATEEQVWYDRTEHLVEGALKAFFTEGVMYERACQGPDNCNDDQRSFKAIFSRSLGMTSVLVPELYDKIRPYLETSAEAAALSCTGGYDGETCGLDWTKGEWDGKYGLGEQMSALEVLMSLLPPTMKAVYTQEDEGVAQGNPEAGIDSDSTSLSHFQLNIQTKDKAGAAIITAFVLLTVVIGGIWMIL